MSENTTAFYRREWLNAPQRGNGFVEASVDSFDADYGYSGADLCIKDCSRQINLDFPLRQRETRENSLAKIAMLLEIMEQFQAALLYQADLAEKWERAREEEKKQPRPQPRRRRIYEDDEPELMTCSVPAPQQLSGGDECDCSFCTLANFIHSTPTAPEAPSE